jgi:hypothetical protein
MARATNYPQPPAQNTTRVGPNDKSVTRVHRPGENSSIPSVSKAEYSTAEHSDARRAEYAREEDRSRANINAELARQAREETQSGQAGRDAANPQGGVGEYLSNN